MKDYEELLLPNIQVKGFIAPPDEPGYRPNYAVNEQSPYFSGLIPPPGQHGCYLQIPKRHRHKKIYSVARNPISRFVSLYEFKHWTSYPFVPDFVLSERYPNFPDLSIEDFYNLQIDAMLYSRLDKPDCRVNVGYQTVQFIQMFFKNPNRVLKNLSDAYLESDDFLEDIAPITFLRQENLRQDLSKALFENHRYSLEEIEIIRQMPYMNVTKDRKIGIEEDISDSLVKRIAERERLLFRIYKHFGIHYDLTLTRTTSLMAGSKDWNEQ